MVYLQGTVQTGGFLVYRELRKRVNGLFTGNSSDGWIPWLQRMTQTVEWFIYREQFRRVDSLFTENDVNG